ncbi:hypothetical protein SAMN05216270_1215 [Glycomyces harbinensis]|uniref:Uncharacterized protein n=2 Tax=Glycomyces harbinensis TaxID=58114 RepID=A0A1G7CSI0_9ACTN|nr:hypothetical protein SAMN05216270_1215 [Glycomyces harbinensis]
MPQAGRPSPQGGGFEPQPRGGAPRAGGPSAGGPVAGRGQQPGQYSSPQRSPQPGGYESGPVTGSTPRTDQWNAGSPPRREAGQAPRGGDYRPRPEGAPGSAPQAQDQPFEEAAFADDRGRDEWGGGSETTAIGRLGYMPKEPRRRSDFQKVRSRARKSSPWPKIGAAVVALALVGGGTWWFMNSGDDEQTGAAGEDSNLTYSGSDEPCSLVDASELEAVVDGAEPEASAEGEEKNTGWVQSCTLTYGEPEMAAALLKIESTVFDSDSMASVNFDLGAREISEMVEAWTPVDPAPEIGDQSAAVSRVPEEGGTTNYQLHLQDDNVYMVVRLAVAEDGGMDAQSLTEMTTALANAYLENWRNAN